MMSAFRLLVLMLAVSTITDAQEARNIDAFTNYDAMKKNGQFFLLSSQTSLYEDPTKVAVPVYILDWFSGFSFDLPEHLPGDTNSSDDDELDDFEFAGYVGRGINYFLGNSLEDMLSSEAIVPKIALDAEKPGLVLEIAASYIPSLGVFDGRWVPLTDGWRCTYWDDGSNRSPFVKEEGHISPYLTNAFVARGVMEWISVERAAALLNVTTDKLTPEEHAKIYQRRWDEMHSDDNDNISSSSLTIVRTGSAVLADLGTSTLLALTFFLY